MKKLVLKSIIGIALLSSSLIGCNNGLSYTGNEWYITGYGSYIKGANQSTEGGIKLEKQEKADDGYSETFFLNDVDFKIGDSLKFVNKNKSIKLKDKYNKESSSFKGNNVEIYEENNVQSLDILKSGKYNIKLNVGGDVKIEITNGTDTSDNKNNQVPTNKTISLLEHGDYHAALNEKDGQVGILKYASFIKNTMNDTLEDDILLSNGDLWQGSYESNVNYGQMLNEFTQELNYSCFNLGNHEFDWGQENIALNQSRINVPYLGANIVNFKTQEYVDYVQPFTIVEREDVKVGVIGTIGVGQWNSITSTMVDDIDFLNTFKTTQKVSDRLRTEFGCHAIVLVTHEPTSTSAASDFYKLGKPSSVTGERYIDAVFFGHDHSATKGLIGASTLKVPYANSGNNGTSLAHITLNIVDGRVESGESELLRPDASTLNEDEQTKAILNKYCTNEIKAKAIEVVGQASSVFASNSEAPNLMAKAVSDYVSNQGVNIDVAVVNVARAEIPSGDVRYCDLSDSFPFFNSIVVMSASGDDIKAVVKNNYSYMPTVKTFDSNKNYIVATYDFVAYHKSLSRTYDNFHSFSVKNTFDIYPVDILTNYWKGAGGPLNPEDYTGPNYQI